MIEAHTLGGTKACEVLVDKLNQANDRKVSKSVCSFLARYNEVICETGKVNIRLKNMFLDLYFEERKIALSNKLWPEEIKSYVLNIIITRHKMAIGTKRYTDSVKDIVEIE